MRQKLFFFQQFVFMSVRIISFADNSIGLSFYTSSNRQCSDVSLSCAFSFSYPTTVGSQPNTQDLLKHALISPVSNQLSYSYHPLEMSHTLK